MSEEGNDYKNSDGKINSSSYQDMLYGSLVPFWTRFMSVEIKVPTR